MNPARILAGKAKRLALAALALAAPPLHAQSGPLAREVKATFLVKFGAYVGWPAAALPDGAPLTLCTIGDDSMGALADAAAQGQSVGSHPIQVRRLATIDRDSGCQIAFLGNGASSNAIAGAPVLTVTDGASGNRRGMIDFTLVGGRVRFSIDQAAAMATGLTISSKLLQIAVSVRQGRR